MLIYKFFVILACVAKSSLAIKSQNESQPGELNSKSVPLPLATFKFLQLNQKLDEISNQHRKIKKSTLNVSDLSNGTSIGDDEQANDTALFKSLKSLKLINSVPTNKKKNVYPGIVFQNVHETQLNEDIEDDLTKFEAYSKLLSQLMHSIVNKDLGLTEMQQNIDKLSVDSNSIAFDNILGNITDKIQRKIDDIHSIIEITGERIQEIFKQQLVSNFTTNYLSCCDFYTSELMKAYANEHNDIKLSNNFKPKEQDLKSSKYNFNSHFNAWINKQFSCDIGDDFRRPHFFSPSGPNLTQQFEANLASYPNIKWQYFMSFLGVHTEYPSYLPPNNYCFLHTVNNDQANFKSTNNEHDNDRMNNFSNGFLKRYKVKNKKHDSLYYHRKAYNELNQLFVQRHRENLLATALPQNKLVVIVIDRGSALTDHQLNIAKAVAKYILNSLSHKDKVAIVDLTSNVQHPSSEICSSKLELAFANYETKLSYSRYIDDLHRSHNSTNHHLGFKRAFEIVASNYKAYKEEINSEPEIFIPYISRGLLASLADAKPVMELIAKELKNCSYTFVINCYALIDESKPIMYETTFLREVAIMNFRKFNVVPPEFKKIRPGLMVALNNTENLSFTLNGIFTVLTKPDSDSYNDIYVSLPHYDFISKDTHISLSRAFFYRDRFLGVVGVDISFMDFAEDIIHDDLSPNSYTFLMETHSGKLLYHPIFSHRSRFSHKHPSKFNSIYDYYLQNSFTNAEHVEQANDFLLVKKLIMTEKSGSHTVQLSFPMVANNESYFNFWNDRHFIKSRYSTVKYYWRRVASSSFVVVIAEYGFNQTNNSSSNNGLHHTNTFNLTQDGNVHLVSHRLDYLSSLHQNDIRLCKHFNQLATTDTASLYLTPSAFVNPYMFESDSDSMNMVQRYMSYLTDSTTKVENPGLKDNIRGDVNLLSTITDLWKELLDTSETSKYIVRKYIATSSGAFMVYPGTLLDQTYEPKTRPWYSRAISNPGKLIFMPPYLDVGGAGYIVTLSQAVFSNKKDHAHSEDDPIWSVMAIDLTLGYFHKIIDEMVPICSGSKSSCFIMDDFGHLIVHSSFLKPTLTAYIERQHITHKEPQMVNDLLNQRNFVRKLVCNNYNDRTIQRHYMFNTSLVGILTNIVQNDESSCAKYKLVSLDGTNAFFGIVNHTCDNSTTFCPCSLTDRLCLNCHRMEQTDCECPCDCPLVMDMCSGQLVEKEDKNPSCLPVPEQLREPSVPKYLFDSLDSCVNSECFNKHSESECKGVLSCEWCSMDNGFKLKKPFCTNQNLCFGGIYGSKNPFMNSNHFYYAEDPKPVYSTPIGPLTTTILVCFVILIISVYCFHFQSARNFGARYLNSNHAEHQILPQANDHNEIIENDFHNEGNFEAIVSLVHAAVNPNFENIASPYQVNTNYRRPTRVESDYGYSTMGPNEDSDMNGSIYIDAPLMKSNKKDLDLLNISTSPTIGTASVISNDDISTLSSPSSASSISSSQRLPPPPSKFTSKVRSKQKYLDHPGQTNLHTTLPPLKENSILDEIGDVLVN